MKPQIRKCIICNIEFVANSWNTITCSYECKLKRDKQLEESRTDYNANCDNCKKAYYQKPAVLAKSKYHFCSVKCKGEYQKNRYSGEGNPFYGKEHPSKGVPRTDEVKSKISASNKLHVEINREKGKRLGKLNLGQSRPSLQGENNPMYGRSDIALKGAMAMMQNQRANYLNGRYVYKGINFRSSWEAAFAIFLDKHKVDWIFEEDSFNVDELGIYIPDFFVPEWDTYFEIKGNENNTASLNKFNRFKKKYDVYAYLIGEQAMKTLGIIIRISRIG